MLSSGPGAWPERILSIARWFVYWATRAWTTRSASCWRTIGSSARPKALAISIALVSSPAPPPPPPPAPIAARSFISVVRATFQPLLTSPRRSESGTRTSVKKTSLKLAPPVIWRSGRISTPGARMSTTKPVRPLCLGRSGSVRAMISPMSLYWAPDVHTFWPVITHSSPSRSALVCRLARSLPAPGSENSWQRDDVAAVHRPQVGVLGEVGAVGEDRRGDHAEADREEALVGDVELRLQGVVGPLVGGRQLAAAVLGRSGDPAEPVVEALGPPLLGPGERRQLGVAVALLEHRHLVGALAPHEALLLGLLVGVGLEEVGHLGLELFDADHPVDGRSAANARYRARTRQRRRARRRAGVCAERAPRAPARARKTSCPRSGHDVTDTLRWRRRVTT